MITWLQGHKLGVRMELIYEPQWQFLSQNLRATTLKAVTYSCDTLHSPWKNRMFYKCNIYLLCWNILSQVGSYMQLPKYTYYMHFIAISSIAGCINRFLTPWRQQYSCLWALFCDTCPKWSGGRSANLNRLLDSHRETFKFWKNKKKKKNYFGLG